MQKSTKIALYFILAPVFLYCIWNFLGIGLSLSQLISAKSQRVNLLFRTDHKALLNACLTILNTQDKGRYNVRNDPHPRAASFPEEILRLKPTYVLVHDSNCVLVEMYGGMYHFGVVAYPKDYTEPLYGPRYGHKELIEGLWYYDDGYEENPNYEKTIESLRPK